jgi:subtilisin family serine protease
MAGTLQFDPALKQLLLRQAGGLGPNRLSAADVRREVPVVVKFRDPAAPVRWLTVVSRFGSIATGRAPLGEIVRIRQDPNVVSLKASVNHSPEEFPGPDQPARALPRFYRSRPPDPGGLSGEGVVVAVAGWGLDVAHENFRDESGSRLLFLWDQRGGRDPRSPEPFGYGREFSGREISDALRSSQPHEQLGYDPVDADRSGSGAHDTHVMDIAAGNGRALGSEPGMAPKADLGFVHLRGDDTRPEDTLGDSVRLLEAVRYIADRTKGRPVVCNLSLGRTGGPHDSSPLVVQALDALCEERPGLVMVLSTGNYFQSQLHSTGVLQPNAVTQLSWQVSPSSDEFAELEIWYAGSDSCDVELVDPDGASLARVALGEDGVVRSAGQPIASIFHRNRDPNNGDNNIDIFLWPDAALGTWAVRLHAVRVADGRFHAWIERDDPVHQSRFMAGQSSPFGTTGTLANGVATIAVGAFDARRPSQPLAPFSSAGPTRDLRSKPDVSAPGVGIWAAKSSRNEPTGRDLRGLTVKSGTSMAAPWVSGVVARMLQASAPDYPSARTVREILMSTAIARRSSDESDRFRSGAGHVDPVGAVEASKARATAVRSGNERDDSAPPVDRQDPRSAQV